MAFLACGPPAKVVYVEIPSPLIVDHSGWRLITVDRHNNITTTMNFHIWYTSTYHPPLYNMLILTKAYVWGAQILISILDDFIDATRLSINLYKTTFAPLHSMSMASTDIASLLGCPISLFLLTYLGLLVGRGFRARTLWAIDLRQDSHLCLCI